MNEEYNKNQTLHPKLGSTVYINIGGDTVRKCTLTAKLLIERSNSQWDNSVTKEIQFEVRGTNDLLVGGSIAFPHIYTLEPSQVYVTANEAMDNKMHYNSLGVAKITTNSKGPG